MSSRQKHWAPRSRTGCNTCRIRHIKCDETKPICNRCKATRSVCEGPFYQSDRSKQVAIAKFERQESASPASTTSTTSTVSISRARSPVFPADLMHEDWQLCDAVKYFNHLQSAFSSPGQLIPSSYSTKWKHQPGSPLSNMYIANVLIHRIFFISRNQSGNSLPAWTRETAHLWTQLYSQLEATLASINSDLRLGKLASDKRILYRILHVTAIESMLGRSTWRLHREGFFAFLEHGGGVKQTLQIANMATKRDILRVLVDSVVSNALSPPTDQIKGLSAFTMADVKRLYRKISEPNFPCPTELFLQIVAIIRLRTQIIEDISWEALQSGVSAVFKGIDAFDPDNWTEDYSIPDYPEVPLVAKIFKISTIIFAVATLPQPPSMTVRYSIKALGDNLVKVLRETWPSPRCTDKLVFPLAIAGFALARGSSEDQDFIHDCLMDTYRIPSGRCAGALVAASNLRSFWLSNMTGWNDCWKELFKLME